LSDGEKEQLEEEIMLIEDMFESMDREKFKVGEVTPVFFGSALHNFGLDVFLRYFQTLAPSPQSYINGNGKDERT
jgi:peptide chain release factor 3